MAGRGGDVRTYQPTLSYTQYIPVRNKRSENPHVFGFRLIASTVGNIELESVGDEAPEERVEEGFDQAERYDHTAPLTVLINPEIEIAGPELEGGWEGCLSVPGLRGVVPRYSKIRYTGTDLQGRPINRIVDGFHARVVQHECDHLDGILYPMRVRDFSRFGYTDILFPEMVDADD